MAKSIINDPVQNAIYDGIKRSIQVCLENECWQAVLVLTYSGIDAMAAISRPSTRADNNRDDFVNWCDKYLRLPGKEQLSGIEYYAARCAVVHTYGVESKLSRLGTCRMIVYNDRDTCPIRFDSAVSSKVLILSIKDLTSAFFEGIDRFLVDACKLPDFESRVQNILTVFAHPSRSKPESELTTS